MFNIIEMFMCVLVKVKKKIIRCYMYDGKGENYYIMKFDKNVVIVNFLV